MTENPILIAKVDSTCRPTCLVVWTSVITSNVEHDFILPELKITKEELESCRAKAAKKSEKIDPEILKSDDGKKQTNIVTSDSLIHNNNHDNNNDRSSSARRSYPPCPDGGWGWMVVFGSFMIHVIADGIIYSFGLFYYELAKHFGESKTATSMVVSIMNGTTYCIGIFFLFNFYHQFEFYFPFFFLFTHSIQVVFFV